MPRIHQKTKEYAKKDLERCIRDKMHVQKISCIKLGEELNDITGQAVSYKIKNAAFSYDELLTVFDLLKFEDSEVLHFMCLSRCLQPYSIPNRGVVS